MTKNKFHNGIDNYRDDFGDRINRGELSKYVKISIIHQSKPKNQQKPILGTTWPDSENAPILVAQPW